MSRVPRPPHPAKVLIAARGETVADVAAGVGVLRSTLYGVLNGQNAPWPALTQRLAEHLDVETSELWLDDRPIADAARRLVEVTRAAQGLPPTVRDVDVLDRIAVLVVGAEQKGGVPDEAA